MLCLFCVGIWAFLCNRYFINASNLFTLLVEGVLALLVALCVAPIFINAEDLDALDVILPIKTVMRWLNFNWTRQNA